MEHYKKSIKEIEIFISILIIDIIRQIIYSGLSPLIYIICIHVLNGNDVKYGIANSFSSIGFLIFSYISGFIGDHLSLRKVLSLSLSLSTVSLLLIYICSISNTDYYFFFLGLLLLYSLSNTLFQMSITSHLPEIVSEKELSTGNSILQLTAALGAFLGPIIVSISFSLGKQGLVSFILFILNSVNILFVLNISSLLIDSKQIVYKKSTLSIFECVNYIFKRSKLVYILISTLLINFAFSLMDVIQILHTVRIWTIPESQALTINSYAGLGAVIGSLAAPLLIKKSYRFAVIVGIFLPNLFIWFLLMPKMNFVFICLIFILLKSSRNIGAVIRVTIQQLSIDDEIRGIIIGTMMTITWGINPIGNIVAGILSQRISTLFVIILASFCITLASVVMMILVKHN